MIQNGHDNFELLWFTYGLFPRHETIHTILMKLNEITIFNDVFLHA